MSSTKYPKQLDRSPAGQYRHAVNIEAAQERLKVDRALRMHIEILHMRIDGLNEELARARATNDRLKKVIRAHADQAT